MLRDAQIIGCADMPQYADMPLLPLHYDQPCSIGDRTSVMREVIFCVSSLGNTIKSILSISITFMCHMFILGSIVILA